jgi:transcriptional regulator with XRE-family HTH domain
VTPDDELDPLRLAVGLAIRRARQDAGMSMRALAVACGLSQPFLSAVERGWSTPSIATLYRLADVLGTAPADRAPMERRGRPPRPPVLGDRPAGMTDG